MPLSFLSCRNGTWWGKATLCQVRHEPVVESGGRTDGLRRAESHSLEVPAGHGPAPQRPKSRFWEN
jgi:hypothetical protein